MTATTLRGNGKRRGTFPRSGRPRNGIGPANRTSPAEPASSGTGQPAVQPPTASWRSGIGEREPRTDRDEGRAVAAGQLVAPVANPHE